MHAYIHNHIYKVVRRSHTRLQDGRSRYERYVDILHHNNVEHVHV